MRFVDRARDVYALDDSINASHLCEYRYRFASDEIISLGRKLEIFEGKLSAYMGGVTRGIG
jgi:hypothetical protein